MSTQAEVAQKAEAAHQSGRYEAAILHDRLGIIMGGPHQWECLNRFIVSGWLIVRQTKREIAQTQAATLPRSLERATQRLYHTDDLKLRCRRLLDQAMEYSFEAQDLADTPLKQSHTWRNRAALYFELGDDRAGFRDLGLAMDAAEQIDDPVTSATEQAATWRYLANQRRRRQEYDLAVALSGRDWVTTCRYGEYAQQLYSTLDHATNLALAGQPGEARAMARLALILQAWRKVGNPQHTKRAIRLLATAHRTGHLRHQETSKYAAPL